MTLERKTMEMLSAHADGELSGLEREKVRTILETDEEARRFFANVQSVSQATAATTVPSEEPSEAEWGTIWRRIKARTPFAVGRRRRFIELRWAIPLTAAAAALLIITFALVWQGRINFGREDNPPMASGTATEILNNGDTIVLEFPDDPGTIIWTVTPGKTGVPFKLGAPNRHKG